jgi:hypothetical protein
MWAAVAPTFPAPTMLIFGLFIFFLRSVTQDTTGLL